MRTDKEVVSIKCSLALRQAVALRPASEAKLRADVHHHHHHHRLQSLERSIRRGQVSIITKKTVYGSSKNETNNYIGGLTT